MKMKVQLIWPFGIVYVTAALVVMSSTATDSPSYATTRRRQRPTSQPEESYVVTTGKTEGISNSQRGRFVSRKKIENVQDLLPDEDHDSARSAQVFGKVKQYDIPIIFKDTAEARPAPSSRVSPFGRGRSKTITTTTTAKTTRITTPKQHEHLKEQYIQTQRQTTRRGGRYGGLVLGQQQYEAPLTTKKTTTTTTPKTTTSTTKKARTSTTPRPNFLENFAFTFFPTNFWNFINQYQTSTEASVTITTPTTFIRSTRKPPKKFLPSLEQSKATATDKLNYRNLLKQPTTKPTKPTTTTTTTTTQHPQVDTGPFRIALPTLNFPEPSNSKDQEKRAAKVASLRERFNCPQASEVRFQLFPKICKEDKDCSVWNRDEICCDIFGAKSCVAGIMKPLEETPHAPILGLIPRKCPTRPLAELWWDVQECTSDMDCWPRVCCPDGRRRYCRTSQPELETAPVPVKRSFNYLTEYLECTPPPPPIFDLHPKACTSTLDCFPNVCCQEAGLRHCRPPKKSVLTLMANVLNVDFVKRLAQNIVIK